MRKVIIIVLAVAVILSILFWKFGPDINIANLGINKELSDKEVTLIIGGLWEEENLIKPAIEEYKKLRPKVNVRYEYKSSLNYRSRTQTQVQEGVGPDIIMLHNSWIPMFAKSNALSPLPESVMSTQEYSQTFYPVIKESLSYQGKIYAVPRGIDGLGLYYNEEILKNAGVSEVPTSWLQFPSVAKKVTVIDASGKIQTAGVALGTAGNIDHWSDILGLLFLQQPGASLERPASAKGAEVLKFYTSFVTDPQNKTWDRNLEPSTQAFAAGRLAFYFAPSWRAHEIRVANPNLKFKIAPVPQLPGTNVAWGTFWAYGVSAKSQNQQEAWEFLKFFTSAVIEKKLYTEAAKVRLFGLPYSRLDLKNELIADPLVGAFVSQGSIYKSWYLNSSTRDQGINDEIIKYYEDAVNATLNGTDPQTALQTTSDGVQQVLDRYINQTTVPAATK